MSNEETNAHQHRLFRTSSPVRPDAESISSASSAASSSSSPESSISRRKQQRRQRRKDASPSQSEEQQSQPSSILRTALIVLLDTPYYTILLAVIAIHLISHYAHTYIEPQLGLLQWTDERARHENTYYKRMCTTDDASAHSAADLLVNTSATTDDLVQSMLTHGISIFPNLLQPSTAQQLRDTILEYNHKVENFGVISNAHRYSYGIPMEQHPSVRTAVAEISTHPVLQRALHGVLGHASPAIYKFHAITSTEGAADQYFHWDVMASASAVQFTRSLAPIYSLFIPLQDTTLSMGPTQVCPGSHVCSDGTAFCEHTAFQVLLKDTNTTAEPAWPMGYGALMNQQTTHRGRAHTGGPERVLFILAVTPQPLDGAQALETRALSLGGSYAVHWTQWGHTWRDLYTHTMYNPIKTLRALGLYKPRDAQWGRDYWMTTLTKIANDEFYSRGDLEYYVEEKPSWLLRHVIPQYLLPALPGRNESSGEGGGDEQEEEDDPRGEVDYSMEAFNFYRQILVNVREESRRIFSVAGYAYAGFYLFGSLIGNTVLRYVFRRRSSCWFPSLSSWVPRMIVIHALVALAILLTRRRVDSRPSSRHIRYNKLYTVPWNNLHGPRQSPATLPLLDDVLLDNDFQSDYLASYTKFLQVGHPGNRLWRRRLDQYGLGYTTAATSVQQALVTKLVRLTTEEQGGRFLTKNYENEWTRLDEVSTKKFVHEQLVRRDNALADALSQQVHFLQSETKFGPFRHTAMYRVHIANALTSWQDHLLGVFVTPPNFRKVITSSAVSSSASFKPQSLAGTPNAPHIPFAEDDDWIEWEPHEGAWLQAGDRVDALLDYNQPYWYPGTIIGTMMHRNAWIVKFDCQEEPRYDVCRYCALPWEPMDNNYVETEVDGTILPGYVVVQHEDSGTMDVAFDKDEGVVTEGVEAWKARRVQRSLLAEHEQTDYSPYTDTAFRIGQPVWSRWIMGNGEVDAASWYAGTVVAYIEQENTYTVVFADGDDSKGLPPEFIRPLTYKAE